MASITVTIPDAYAQRVLDAIAGTYGFDPNDGFTKAQFAKQYLAGAIKQILIAYEGTAAAETARLSAITNASQVPIT